MGDDLGDEWWKQEGKSGILLNSTTFISSDMYNSGLVLSELIL